MEGLVPGNRVDQFKDQLKEGCVYTIDKFDLSDPKKTYRSVDHPLRICFSMRTVLIEVLPPPENFPKFTYTALPFSRLSDRIDEKIVLSGSFSYHLNFHYIDHTLAWTTYFLTHTFAASSSEPAIVTLWGEQADLFDVDGLIDLSNEEPVIVLFVGMTVSQYSGLLAFKSTSVTRWYVNVPILEIAAVRERSKNMPSRIELQGGKQNDVDPTASSIIEIATFEPNDIMVAPDSSGRPKRKNVGTIKNPKTKKGLHFSDDD
ncbi:hypothetical protein ACQ4PT_053293 [Festuca glaucescens]